MEKRWSGQLAADVDAEPSEDEKVTAKAEGVDGGSSMDERGGGEGGGHKRR